MIRIFAWLALVVLTSCASGDPLPVATGPWHALNADRWTPSEAELQAIRALPQ
jgi:hypothetical protein